MKTFALYHISLVAQFSTYATAAPPIIPPSILEPNSGNLLGTLTSLANNNATPHTTLGISPPPTPFNLRVPNTNLLLTVSYTAYIRDRIEHWAHQALRTAYNDVTLHPRSESISDAISPDTYVRYDGNPDGLAHASTDIELVPERNLTYGLFADCLGMLSWFAMTYPEWDFAFDVEMVGAVGRLGRCGFTTRS